MDANIQHPLIVGGVDLVEEHLRRGISNAECIAGLYVHAGFRFGSAMNRRDRQLYDICIECYGAQPDRDRFWSKIRRSVQGFTGVFTLDYYRRAKHRWYCARCQPETHTLLYDARLCELVPLGGRAAQVVPNPLVRNPPRDVAALGAPPVPVPRPEIPIPNLQPEHVAVNYAGVVEPNVIVID